MIPLAECGRVAKVSNRNARPASEQRISYCMKLMSFLPALAAVCTLTLPHSALARDKDGRIKAEKSVGISRSARSEQGSRSDRNDRNDRNDRHDKNDHRGHDHRGPNIYIRPSFGYGSGYGYGYGSSYYGRSPYYYSRPSVGYSYHSRPSAVYRGQAVYGSYSDGLAVDVQRELRRRGYYRGAIDGDIGPGSRAAIRAYQYDRGLSTTGRIDSSLLRSLGIG